MPLRSFFFLFFCTHVLRRKEKKKGKKQKLHGRKGDFPVNTGAKKHIHRLEQSTSCNRFHQPLPRSFCFSLSLSPLLSLFLSVYFPPKNPFDPLGRLISARATISLQPNACPSAFFTRPVSYYTRQEKGRIACSQREFGRKISRQITASQARGIIRRH